MNLQSVFEPYHMMKGKWVNEQTWPTYERCNVNPRVYAMKIFLGPFEVFFMSADMMVYFSRHDGIQVNQLGPLQMEMICINKMLFIEKNTMDKDDVISLSEAIMR